MTLTISTSVFKKSLTAAAAAAAANKMIVFTLVRHGETKMNAAKIVQSRTHGELSERGIKMAQSLGEKLKEEKFTRIYSSDLKRCHDTTIHILQNSIHKQPEIQLNEILRERDYGDYEFQPVQVVLDQVAQHGCLPHVVPLPTSETYLQVLERTKTFFDSICSLADEGNENCENILVVSHGNWIQSLLDYIMNNQINFKVENLSELISMNPLTIPSPMNTSTTKFTIGKSIDSIRQIHFKTLYDVSHLNSINH